LEYRDAFPRFVSNVEVLVNHERFKMRKDLLVAIGSQGAAGVPNDMHVSICEEGNPLSDHNLKDRLRFDQTPRTVDPGRGKLDGIANWIRD
jgi:hypothetical protein